MCDVRQAKWMGRAGLALPVLRTWMLQVAGRALPYGIGLRQTVMSALRNTGDFMIAPQQETQTVFIRVKRQDTPTSDPYWQDFEAPFREGSNVISCLQAIAADPVTVDGRQVSPVVWDCNCLEEVCGACTMVMNDVVGQSCSKLVHELTADGRGTKEKPIILEPMSKFPVVRDLFVDRQRMFDNLKTIQGWVPIDSMGSLGVGPRESQPNQELRYDISRCMTCGCCLEACPQFTKDNGFVGAQVIAQALYFNKHEIGAHLKGERLDTDGVPEPLKTLIDRLSAPDPDARFQNTEAVLAFLDAPKAAEQVDPDATVIMPPPRQADPEPVTTKPASKPKAAPVTTPEPRKSRGGLIAVLLVGGTRFFAKVLLQSLIQNFRPKEPEIGRAHV